MDVERFCWEYSVRLHKIDGMFVYVAYFEVMVDCCMFTFVTKRIIFRFVVVLFNL
jgi:hypothetical protein